MYSKIISAVVVLGSVITPCQGQVLQYGIWQSVHSDAGNRAIASAKAVGEKIQTSQQRGQEERKAISTLASQSPKTLDEVEVIVFQKLFGDVRPYMDPRQGASLEKKHLVQTQDSACKACIMKESVSQKDDNYTVEVQYKTGGTTKTATANGKLGAPVSIKDIAQPANTHYGYGVEAPWPQLH